MELVKKDIGNRDDLKILLESFYRKLLADPTINYLFTDVARIDMMEHLPLLVDFWDSILFGSDTYHKNAMIPHLQLHQKSPLRPEHFETWLRYFNQTLDELFEGEITNLARQRASGIAAVIRLKTQYPK